MDTYNYQAVYKWDTTVWIRHEVNGYPDVSQAVQDAFAIMKQAVTDEFNKKLLSSGHFYRLNSVNLEGGNGMPSNHTSWFGGIGVQDGFDVPVSGKATVNFDTDVEDMMAHGSPQLWDIIIAVTTAVVDAIEANPTIFLIGCIVIIGIIAVAFALQQLTNLTKGITELAKTPGGGIAVAAVGIAVAIGAVIVAIYYIPKLLPTKKALRKKTYKGKR